MHFEFSESKDMKKLQVELFHPVVVKSIELPIILIEIDGIYQAPSVLPSAIEHWRSLGQPLGSL